MIESEKLFEIGAHTLLGWSSGDVKGKKSRIYFAQQSAVSLKELGKTVRPQGQMLPMTEL